MPFDRDRIRTILNAEHSYYGSRRATIRQDYRPNLYTGDFIAAQFTPTMNVLDLGCGRGDTLLDHSESFHTGIGIDYDPDHIRMAREAKRARAIQNVKFLLLDFPREVEKLEPESFDVVFSQRGPIDVRDLSSFPAALRLLRPNGIIFCDEIGELHLSEVDEIFGSGPHSTIPMVEQVRAEMERNGVSIRLTADLFSKWYYPDIYEWLLWQCSLWSWLGKPFPEPDDPRIDLFAERNTIATGEIETTHHVVWVAGVKQQG